MRQPLFQGGAEIAVWPSLPLRVRVSVSVTEPWTPATGAEGQAPGRGLQGALWPGRSNAR